MFPTRFLALQKTERSPWMYFNDLLVSSSAHNRKIHRYFQKVRPRIETSNLQIFAPGGGDGFI